MKNEWFDPNTNYLKYPPLYREIKYANFKSFYEKNRTVKGKSLQLLESYCQEFREGGYNDHIKYLLLANNFLKSNHNNEKPTVTLTGLLICDSQFSINTTDEFKYFAPKGRIASKYQPFIGLNCMPISVQQNSNMMEILSEDSGVIDLSKKHQLSHINYQMCMVLLHFEEVKR